jgi:hypothetical protein
MQSEVRKTISFEEVWAWVKFIFHFGLNQWKLLFLAGFMGGMLGIGIAMLNKPKYKASLSFLLNENEGGMNLNLSSIAGLAGAYGMGGGGQVNEDKLLFIANSRNIIGQTLLRKVTANGKEDLLINHFIEEFKLIPSFASDTALKDFKGFTHTNLEHFSYAENKVLDKIYLQFQKGGMYSIDAKKKAGIVAQGAGIITLSFVSNNEALSKVYIDCLYAVLSNYYIQKATVKQLRSYELICQRADSLKQVLFEREGEGANYLDQNKGLIKMTKRLSIERAKRDVEMLGLMYAEVLKNQEVARFTLENQTPVFQVIDVPTFPLEKIKLSKIKSGLIAVISFVFICFIFLLFKKIGMEGFSPITKKV